MTTEIHIAVSEHLCVTELRRQGKPALVECLNDKDIYANTLRIPHPYASDDAETFLRIAAEAAEKHGHPVHFAIRDGAGSLIGGCGFDALLPGHKAELGYWLAKPFWGRGLMTQTVRAVCDFARSEWKLVRITARVFDFNTASARVLEKCGFELEGLLRKHHRKDGRFLNSKLYALVE